MVEVLLFGGRNVIHIHADILPPVRLNARTILLFVKISCQTPASSPVLQNSPAAERDSEDVAQDSAVNFVRMPGAKNAVGVIVTCDWSLHIPQSSAFTNRMCAPGESTGRTS